jgi:hypothetical protein
LRNLIKLAVAVLAGLAIVSSAAAASAPSVADLDAAARAIGNRRDLAERIGVSVFATPWPAEVSQISANSVEGHLVVGIRIWGVKFHTPMTREQFVDEVVSVVERAFAAAPATEEVDVWASIPIAIPKGEIVSGDLAKPTTHTVFSLTVRRGESAASLRARAAAPSADVFWDPQWARDAFKESS